MKKYLITLFASVVLVSSAWSQDISEYAEDKILDHSLGTTSWTMPTVYLALGYEDFNSVDIFDAEVDSADYARTPISFDAASNGSTSNSAEITFTTSSAWGTVDYIALVDSPVELGGNVIWATALDNPRTLASGDTLTFSAGSITVTLD